MVKRVVIVGSVVLILGVGFASGRLAYQRGSHTPRESSTVSAYPEPPMTVQVPSLVGLPLEVAIDRLRRLGLDSSVASGLVVTVPDRGVLRQTPTAGTVVSSGTTVRLYVS